MSLLKRNPMVSQGTSVVPADLAAEFKKERKKSTVVFSYLALAAHGKVTPYTKIFKEMVWKGTNRSGPC